MSDHTGVRPIDETPMTKADVRSFMEGILASIQSLILGVVVFFGAVILSALIIPIPESGLAFELITISLFLVPACGWMFVKLTAAARRGARTYSGFLAGVVVSNIIAEILVLNGLIPEPPGEPVATVIPEWLVSVWAYVLLGATAYAGYHVGKGKREADLSALPPAPAPTPSHGPYGAPGPGA